MLHLVRRGVKFDARNFLTGEQKARLKDGTLLFMPSPPDTVIAPLEIGWINRNAQTPHPAQKPLRVIEQLFKMVATPDAVVVDPTCGSGTAGEAARLLGMRAILGDEKREYLSITKRRLGLRR